MLVAAGGHGHRLRVAVGHVEAVDHELGRLATCDVHRVGRVGRRLGDGQGERHVLAELGLDERLVVGELEDVGAPSGIKLVAWVGRGGRLAEAHLDGQAECAVGRVGVLVGEAVAGVKVSRQTLVVAGHRGRRGVAHERLVDGVVGRRCRHLPAGAVQHLLGGGVVVDEELEADPRHEPVERPGLGLRRWTGPAILVTAARG